MLFSGTFKRNILLQYILLAGIVVLSFRFFSYRYYPALNSDDAVNILMAHHLDFPQDLYYWGQDRAGSIIPITGHVLYKITGCSPAMAVSFAHYFFLLTGYFAFASFFKSRFSKIVFALMWFMPAARFIDLTRMQIGIQYSLLALVMFLVSRINPEKNEKWRLRDHAYMTAIVLLLIIDIWVSDISALSFMILAAVLYFFHYRHTQKFVIRPAVIMYALLGIVLCYACIAYAKQHAAAHIPEYMQRNSVHEALQATQLMKKYIGTLLKFQAYEPWMSVWSYLALVTVLTVMVLTLFNKVQLSAKQKFLVVFLALDFCLMLAAIVFSKWTLLNLMGRRYFVGHYITLSVLMVLLVESLMSGKTRHILQGVLLLTALVGAYSTIDSLKNFFPRTLKPKLDIVGEFKQLGNVGFIGDYWNSYISAASDPDHIKATPNEQSNVRKPALALEVLNQPRIFLIKDMWLEHFPDTIVQFQQRLVKKGDSLQLGDCTICEYVKR